MSSFQRLRKGWERSECVYKRAIRGILIVMEMLCVLTVLVSVSRRDTVLSLCNMSPLGGSKVKGTMASL